MSIQNSDRRTWRPTYKSNRGEQALAIVQSQIVRIAYKIRNYRLSGHFELMRMEKIGLFELIEVRRILREAKIWEPGHSEWDIAA